MIAHAAVHDSLTMLADPTRGRILLVLERNELTVGELCAVLQLPQSTVSRHLRLLSDEGWVVSRQEGTSRFYAVNAELDDEAKRLWSVVGDALTATVAAAQDLGRVEAVLSRRRAKSREFFSESAAHWDAVRAQLYGERSDLVALMGLLPEQWVVGDLGCGTGRLTELLAPNAKSVIAVDASEEMLKSARERVGQSGNVDWRVGELDSLPIETGTLDAAVLSLVLHYAPDPARGLGECRRAMRPGGRFLLIDLVRHDHAEYRQQMGHVWLGFAEGQIRGWLRDAGFENVRFRQLPADAGAKGPPLFVAAATCIETLQWGQTPLNINGV